ncbi:hypothetical protein [Levilactobacillus brevis]|uniref:hypothetical protein n=1 Tax=Levilactobacillus brevis TaxID=1580 RepID=UPI001CDADB0E|nr:hypothetical protein [Levilactobacillus brevis]
MSANSRMAWYHATEEPEMQETQSVSPYQRRPALARWLAVLVLLLTLTVGLRMTIFNATYTAGVVSRSTTGEKVINQLNDELQSYGISGSPITTSLAQPYLAMGVAQLYGQTPTTSVDDTDLSSAVSSQAVTMGTTASNRVISRIAKQAGKLAKTAFGTPAMKQAAIKIQFAQKVNLWVMIATLLLLVVTFFYALSVHHVFASLGPGLTLGGLLTTIAGAVSYVGLPLVVTSSSQTVAALLTTIGHNGLAVIIFMGIAEIIVGLVVLLGHRTFRNA